MSLIIECSNCQGQVKIPDDFPGGEVGCAHCGTMLSVSMPGQPAPGPGTAGGAGHHHHPISPEEYRMEVQRKRGRGCLIKSIVLLVVVGGGLGYALTKMSFKELIERTKATSSDYIERFSANFPGGNKESETGVTLLGSYETKSLPGLRGQPGDEGGWKIEDEGKIYFVVVIDVTQRHFLPGEKGYQGFVISAAEKQKEKPSHEMPSQDQCRVFDPKSFKLLVPGGDPLEGALINISMGEYKGFYDSFRMVLPKSATDEEDKEQLEKSMDVEVAFVVEEGSDLSALRMNFKDLEAMPVPAP